MVFLFFPSSFGLSCRGGEYLRARLCTIGFFNQTVLYLGIRPADTPPDVRFLKVL